MSEEIYEQQGNCSNDCSSCGSSCSSRQPSKEDFSVPMNPYSKVKRVIGVVSGKGGVGKSFVTSYLSVLMNKRGFSCAVLDADITGPSIPKAFGIHKQAGANELGILPEITKNGIEIMSVNLLLEEEETPVVWRGPVIAGTVKQFWSEVVWGDVDYMFVDMPPGTGDVPLTVFQSLPLDGVIIVTSPQELVSMIVAKAVNMANAMKIPVLGLVENYSFVACGSCGEKIHVFGESHIEATADKFKLPVLAKLPIHTSIAESMDLGKIEELAGNWLDHAADFIAATLPVQKKSSSDTIKIAVASDEQNKINQHFGHCTTFTIYEIADKKLKDKTVITNPGCGHEAAAGLMIGEGVKVLICGGIGNTAMELLLDHGILVIPGMQGDIDVAVASYLDGSISASSDPTCCNKEEDGGCSCAGNCGCSSK